MRTLIQGGWVVGYDGRLSSRQFAECSDFLNCTDHRRLTRHPIDNATRLILTKSTRTRLAHTQQTTRTVFAHAGENDSNCIASDYFSC